MQLAKTMGAFGVNEPQARAIDSSLRSTGFSLIQGCVARFRDIVAWLDELEL